MTQPETPEKATPSPAILHGFASMTLLPAVGEVEVRSVDGQVGTVRGLPLLPAQVTVKASFFPDVYAVELLLHDGEVIRLEVGTGAAKIDSPVAYLDQNIWIDLARVQAGSTKALRPERVASCEKLIWVG